MQDIRTITTAIGANLKERAARRKVAFAPSPQTQQQMSQQPAQAAQPGAAPAAGPGGAAQPAQQGGGQPVNLEDIAGMFEHVYSEWSPLLGQLQQQVSAMSQQLQALQAQPQGGDGGEKKEDGGEKLSVEDRLARLEQSAGVSQPAAGAQPQPQPQPAPAAPQGEQPAVTG